MEVINNVSKTLRDDLATEIKKGSKVSIVASCFSIYAFQELKKELKNIEELRFIFTSPTFTTEQAPKEMREFFIPRFNREKSLYGTEFEVRLRNTLSQKAIAKECAKWIEKKVRFKSNITNEFMQGFLNVDNINYSPIKSFTTVDLGCKKGNNAYSCIYKVEAPMSEELVKLFDKLWKDKNKLQDVTSQVIENISVAYKENSPEFIYFIAIYNIFNEFLEELDNDTLPNEAVGFKESKIWNMLYDFQKDAVLSIINKLEKYNGCILADSVGLGKTFSALAVIKYYEARNRNVLVLCPKKLSDNWNTYRDNYINNPLAEDRLNYKVLYHTDINRKTGFSNGTDLSRLRWDTYDLIVIDESHNFRNGGKLDSDDEKDNRYSILMKNVIRKGVKTKVLMLSATPVNNRFNDLKNQLQLAYEGNSSLIDNKLKTKHSIDEIFRNAQRAFNNWSNLGLMNRTTDKLLRMLDFDFFEVLDSVTIARSRKHIEKFYDMDAIGNFPDRLLPKSYSPKLSNLPGSVNYNDIFEKLMSLNLDIYTPSHYILKSKVAKYAEIYGDNKVNIGITQANREQGIRRLMAINLMKRMESSVHSFRLTIKRITETIEKTIYSIDNYDKRLVSELLIDDLSSSSECDFDDQNSEDFFSVGKKAKIDLGDMDRVSWKRQLEKDKNTLTELYNMTFEITPEYDSKLQTLFEVLSNKIKNPINDNNKKIIIFTAFADTAMYIYDNVSKYMLADFGLNTAVVTGVIDGKTTIPKFKANMNQILMCFSPLSKDKKLLMPDDNNDIDILIATDCISEGQNLQDCDYLINYDIHWNPVRIIQRFGRIDRIGSHNKKIQLVNFWPDVTLDEYINLKSRVETRMKIVNMTATGDDNLLSREEQELEYRKSQLRRLREEVVDIEEMSTGISIMDLGLNQFRLDLLDYMKSNHDVENAPMGMHSVAYSTPEAPAGVIYILRNTTENINIDNKNLLHPFYMVYIKDDGEIFCDHLSPKNMLEKMNMICKGKKEPIPELYKPFNKETKDGQNMEKYSDLLNKAISSIIEVKEESDMDLFLSGGDMSFKNNQIKGLDDFELICFLVIRDKEEAVTGNYKLVVAGSRDYDNYDDMCKNLEKYLHKYGKNLTIISGNAQGADMLGERYAKEHNLQLELHPANWELFGNNAGPIRNSQMAKICDEVLVFWDGASAGTKDMIKCAYREDKPCTIVRF